MVNKRILLPALFILFAVPLLFASTNQIAKAAEIEYESTWEIHVDFVGDKVNAELTVEVWEYTDGTISDFLTTTRPLRCRVPNDVVISDNEATFSGGRGIRCNVPSRQRIIYNMTEGAYTPPARCDCKSSAFGTTEITLDPNLTGQVRYNPIFTMRDLEMGAEMPPFPTLTTLIHFEVDGAHAFSESFLANPALNTLSAFFNQVNGPNTDDYAYHPIFLENGNTLLSNPPDIEEDLSLPLKREFLIIGDAPGLNNGLYGSITSLDIDPGCFGTG